MEPTSSNTSDRRPVVLYVEDHPVNAVLMEALFERRPGLRLVIAETGQAALRVAQGLNPQLLLLDLQLPDCHGSELLPLLRQLPGCSRAPAVAVTANSDFDINGTGFVELWPKPMNLDLVLERLDRLLPGAGAAVRSPSPQNYRMALGTLAGVMGV
jgi:CheY-like chemotaxis protein